MKYGVSRPHSENGFGDSLSLLQSEKAVQEILQQTPVHGSDDHLIEFSEALRTVAKALRRAAEGKAAAQAEAAEWKRRFELERARNLRLENKVSLFCSYSASPLVLEFYRFGSEVISLEIGRSTLSAFSGGILLRPD
ncbi:hypothetical protein CUMW_102040 [Citrus unshiu]|nr:hypothetical protein CUMW_102040 [Citrus unshiu]